MQATRGAVVSLNYTLTDDEGTILGSNLQYEPLDYLHGYDNIIAGLERALDGVEEGFKSTVIVEAADAYGEADPQALFEVSKEHFPEEVEVEVGMELMGETPSGEVSLVVVEVREASVIVDANHPLAGRRLTFDVEVVGVRTASDEELELGHPQQAS